MQERIAEALKTCRQKSGQGARFDLASDCGGD